MRGATAHSVPTERKTRREHEMSTSYISIANKRIPSIHRNSSGQSTLKPIRAVKQREPGLPHAMNGDPNVINTEDGFTITLDTRHFQYENLKTVLEGDTLAVYGDRFDEDNSHSVTFRRTFLRRYCIPSDIKLSSITSYLNKAGYLVIKGRRKRWVETDLTVQATMPASPKYTWSNKISTV